MASLSVSQAAARLGLSVSRVHQRIADGSLHASRVGSQWVIDERSLSSLNDRHVPGRPLSERSAWALAALSQSTLDDLGPLAPAEVSRARARLARLLEASAAHRSRSDEEAAGLLRALLRNRARREPYRASPFDLADLRRDNRIVPSGISDPRSGIASGDIVEGYVRVNDRELLVNDYLLSDVAVDDDANVVLHVVAAARLGNASPIAPLWIAADLAEYRSPREESRAVELVREIAGRGEAGEPSLESASNRRRSSA